MVEEDARNEREVIANKKRLNVYLMKELHKFQAEVEAGEYINPERLKFSDFVKD